MAPNWDEVRFVVASTYRTTVPNRLMSGPATPSIIADDAEIALSYVSRALTELREHGLVASLQRTGRRAASTASPPMEQMAGNHRDPTTRLSHHAHHS